MATADDRQQDPIADLAMALTALDRYASRAGTSLRRNEHNRIGLLYVHAIAALLVAPLFIASSGLFQSPSWSFMRLIPGFPWSFSVLLLTGGLILLPATIARIRALEMVALSLLSIWYTLLAIGFFIPAVGWGAEALPAVVAGEPLPKGQPGLYAWAVYGHLSVIMRVHLWTLWRMEREHLAAAGEPARDVRDIAIGLVRQLRRRL